MLEKLASELRDCLIFFSKSLAFPPDPEMTSGQESTCFQLNLTKAQWIALEEQTSAITETNKDRTMSEHVTCCLVSRGSRPVCGPHARISGDGKRVVHGTEFNRLLLLREVLRGPCRVHPSQGTAAGFFPKSELMPADANGCVCCSHTAVWPKSPFSLLLNLA